MSENYLNHLFVQAVEIAQRKRNEIELNEKSGLSNKMTTVKQLRSLTSHFQRNFVLPKPNIDQATRRCMQDHHQCIHSLSMERQSCSL